MVNFQKINKFKIYFQISIKISKKNISYIILPIIKKIGINIVIFTKKEKENYYKIKEKNKLFNNKGSKC